MDNRRALIWSFCVYLDWRLNLIRVVARVVSFGSETGEIGHFLLATNCLKVFLKHFFSRRRTGIRKNQDLVRIFQGRTVLHEQTRYDLRALDTIVAGVAGHGAHALEVVFVDGVYHQQHLSCGLLQRSVFREFVPTGGVVGRVAVDAVHACRGGNHAHRIHELVYWNSFENLNILENIFRHLRPLALTRLAICHQSKEAQYNCPNPHQLFWHSAENNISGLDSSEGSINEVSMETIDLYWSSRGSRRHCAWPESGAAAANGGASV